MNTKKLLIGSVVGTVAVFLLDYLIYAVLLTDIFAPVPGCERSPMPDFAWLIPGLFIVLFLLFEPRGLAALWLRAKTWFLTWPFSY